MKTNFDSYCLNGIAKGCKYCIKGEKLVLFITGICSRNCYYCSLSNKRKNKDIIWANERECKSIKDAIEEARESNAKGAGITGGDPLLKFERTLKYAKALKSNFKNFHIHIYLPTKLVTKDKLKKLSKYIDEARFHPAILAKNLSKKETNEEIEKIKQASLIFGKENTGIELPIIPEKKKQIFDFILKIKNFIGFVNLNELELSDTNFNLIVNKYKLKENGYVVVGSKEAGLWILNQLSKNKTNLKVHLCTADTKNWHQYKNRLKQHSIFPFGKRTKDGTVKYFAIYYKNKQPNITIKQVYLDKPRKRIILSEKAAKSLLNKYKIEFVEEYPTYDHLEVERGPIC